MARTSAWFSRPSIPKPPQAMLEVSSRSICTRPLPWRKRRAATDLNMDINSGMNTLGLPLYQAEYGYSMVSFRG
eukprot:5000013-Amphidinium_carterae.1